jgi:hypothetical protein
MSCLFYLQRLIEDFLAQPITSAAQRFMRLVLTHP